MNSITKFIPEMISEFKRVVWPSRETTWESVKVVVNFSLLLVAFIFIVDQFLNKIVGFFIS